MISCDLKASVAYIDGDDKDLEVEAVMILASLLRAFSEQHGMEYARSAILRICKAAMREDVYTMGVPTYPDEEVDK